ncbi:methyl-accepting chemotaxis protein MCP signaling domain protein [Asticcacaulis biprosthecium C19]|uniref:Methyl-accepting chemotaxis protein MCP signaling domain protein n=1 Tax=Asticcacaulis biprosthecium C19 TaxID=715226 RepID=F4QT40_9CAUL|nr:methyl-accepting chemotaxis protein [Asticcacaulis biprosthecium]EGF89910.1 methyl-accepting chemotaxis protein MCP signaling domain protein [Asticcacaulis biprosthecium C19]
MARVSFNTISAKAGFAAMLSFVLCLGIAGLGFYSVNKLGSALTESTQIAKMMQNQMEADMAHDAIRGEVVAAMYAVVIDRPQDLARAQEGANENTEIFRDRVAANVELIKDPTLVKTADTLTEPVKAYAAMAEEIIALAASDYPAAQGRMAQFNAAYYELIGTMENVSEAIDAYSARERGAAQRDASAAATLMGATIVVALILCGLTIAGVYFVIAKPLKTMVMALAELARGQADLSHLNLKAKGELGEMARSIKDFSDLQTAHAQTEREAADAGNRQTLEKAQALDALCQTFSRDFEASIHELSAASGTLNGDSRHLSDCAGQTDQQTHACSEATQVVSGNVDQVSSAADILNTAISDITGRMQASTEMARRAYESGKSAEAIITELAHAADQISEVVALINDLAVQTNVLALNATIEAARAGEAGKGFAVVATEVKALAAQTSHSTDSISKRVEDIRRVSDRSADTLRDIIQAVEHLHDIAQTVSGRVDEQARTTAEMSHVVRRASHEAQTAAQASQRLAGLTAQTHSAGRNIETASQQIDDATSRLKVQGERFIQALRSA